MPISTSERVASKTSSRKITSPESALQWIMQCNAELTVEEATLFLETYQPAFTHLLKRNTQSGAVKSPRTVIQEDETHDETKKPAWEKSAAHSLMLRFAAHTIRNQPGDPIVHTCNNVALNNRVAMPGSVMRLRGNYFVFDKHDVNQGVFLIADNGLTVRIHSLVRFQPNDLIFMIPDGVPAGEYRVEVRSIDRQTAEKRVGAFADTLTLVV